MSKNTKEEVKSKGRTDVITRMPVLEKDLEVLGIDKEKTTSREIYNTIREKVGLEPIRKVTQKSMALEKLGLPPTATQKEVIEAINKLNKEKVE